MRVFLMSSFIVAMLVGALTAQIKVVTTQPDLADIARIIGGDGVEVTSLTDGTEDLHLVRIRPSLLIKVRRADVFIQLGLDAEHSWVPPLLRTARNDKVAPGGSGFISCARGVAALAVPTTRSRSERADMHPRGNPHFNLDPESMRVAARTIRDGLARAAPGAKAGFDRRLAAWEQELDARMKRWTKTLQPLKGAAFIEHHDAWIYFANRFGLSIVARLEPKPGLAPTPGHLRDVVAVAKRDGVGLVVARPANIDVARKVAAETGATATSLTLSSTTEGATSGYLRFIDHVVATFAAGLKKP